MAASDMDPSDAKLIAQARAAAAAQSAETARENARAAAAAQESRAALARLTSGATLTNAERAILNMAPVPAATTATAATTVTSTRSGITAETGTRLGDVLAAQNADRAARDAAFANKPTDDPGPGNRWVWQERNRTWAKVSFSNGGGFGPTGNTGDTGGTGGGNNAATDALKEMLAQQQAAAKAAADAAAAAKMASKIKASDRLTNLFKGYGIEGLATFINKRIMEDASEESVLIELYDQPEYKLRFPGMESLRKKNRTISEKEYIDIENAFVQTARFFDIPKGFYDSADDFGNLIANEVSAKEFQDRLQVGQDVGKSLDPNVRAALKDFYGIGEGGITAYVLNADKALPILQKQAKAATIAGIAKSAGFNTIYEMGKSEELAGMDAYAKLSEQQLKQGFGTAQAQRGVQQRLARIEGVAYNEQEALQATIEGSAMAQLESKKRAEREAVFRFGGRSGVGGTSLRSTTNQ